MTCDVNECKWNDGNGSCDCDGIYISNRETGEPLCMSAEIEARKTNDDENELISLTEYAALHDVDPSTVRHKIRSGNFEAKKIGRNWLVKKNQPWIDNRRK